MVEFHFLDKGHLYISEKKSSKKKFIVVVPYSKIDKNDLLTWTDYQQNKKVEFLTAIFTFHLLPKILSRDRLPIGMTCTKSPCFKGSPVGVLWTGMYPAPHMCMNIFLNMMNREYLVENFQVLYNWLFRNFQFSNFNFFLASES